MIPPTIVGVAPKVIFETPATGVAPRLSPRKKAPPPVSRVTAPSATDAVCPAPAVTLTTLVPRLNEVVLIDSLLVADALPIIESVDPNSVSEALLLMRLVLLFPTTPELSRFS